MNDSPKNRQIRVFISSTFRDFAEERDLLVKKIFPELRKRCRERKVELIDVDLRWGITEEEAQQGKVLPICLAEIDRARPYFMGLIGERYGWVPEADHYAPSLLQEQPWIEEHRGGRSVTELEVLHGVLNNPAMTGRAFFYFRDPAYSASKGGAYLSEGTADQQKLDALKECIRQSGFPVVESYPTPEALADKVRDDLWNLIDETFPASETPDPLAIERGRHEAYSASRLGLYLGGETYFRAMDVAMAENDAFKPVLITGASGGGKSALVANWSAAYTKNHPSTLLHLHHLGAGADAADPVKLVTRLMQEIARITGDELKLEADPQKLFDLLPEWLARASAYASHHRKEWLMVLDGLDKLSTLRDLRWWPAMLPPKVKLIASCLEGEVLESLRKRMEWTDLEVHPLTRTDQRTFITDFLGRYRKSLTLAQVERVQAHALSGNSLFLLTLLEELRVFGVHEELEQRLSFYLQSETVDDLFERVLERVEGDTSADAVRSAMEAIWASRAGLAQDELLAITGLVPATWAPIHNALDEAILESGGRLNYGHDYFRKAVEDRYLPSPEKQKTAHLCLAEWFDQQEVTARVAEELPWQWQQAEEEAKLKECLTRREMFMALHERDDYELLGYWLSLTGENIEQAYKKEWGNWASEAPTQVVFGLDVFLQHAGFHGPFTKTLRQKVCDISEKVEGPESDITLSCLLAHALLLMKNGDYVNSEPILRRVLAWRETDLGLNHEYTLLTAMCLGNLLLAKGNLETADFFLRRAFLGYNSVCGHEDLSTLEAANNLANLLAEQGNYLKAQELYKMALSGYEKNLGPGHPDTQQVAHNLALVSSDLGDYEAAEKLCRRVSEVNKTVLGPEHPDTLTSMDALGDILRTRGDYNEAEELLRNVLEIRNRVLGSKHPETLGSITNLGLILDDLGNFAGAESLYQRALKTYTNIFGENHPSTLNIVNSLAVTLENQGRLDEAQLMYGQTLERRERVLGAEHPDTLDSVNNLAGLLRSKGDFLNAEILYKRAKEGFERSLNSAHPKTLRSFNNLGLLLKDQGRYVEAEELLLMAVAGYEKAYGPKHPITLNSVSNLISILYYKGETGVNEYNCRKALSGRKSVIGSTHPCTLACANNLGILLRKHGDYEEAEKVFRETLEIELQSLGKNDPATIGTIENLSSLLYSKGDFQEAEKMCELAIEANEKSIGAQHPDTLDSVLMLGTLLNKRGKNADAAALLGSYAEIFPIAMQRLRYNLACYECLSGNDARARQLITAELIANEAPAARRVQMLEDSDLQSIHDFIRAIPVL